MYWYEGNENNEEQQTADSVRWRFVLVDGQGVYAMSRRFWTSDQHY